MKLWVRQCPKGAEAGSLSGIRQRDVISEWLPVPASEEPTGIVLRGRRGKSWRRWNNGLTWANLGKDLEGNDEDRPPGLARSEAVSAHHGSAGKDPG
jgi:hypothetical protein